MDEITVLDTIRDLLRQDAQNGELYQEQVRSIEISEGGEIDDGTPLPALAINGDDISFKARTMSGISEWGIMNVVVHVYLDVINRDGPEPGSKQLKRICARLKTLLQRNTLGLTIQVPLVGVIRYPGYNQRNYTDRREGRVPITYRWVG
jgi:hypothetical protein